jgi:hypothetical protein
MFSRNRLVNSFTHHQSRGSSSPSILQISFKRAGHAEINFYTFFARCLHNSLARPGPEMLKSLSCNILHFERAWTIARCACFALQTERPVTAVTWHECCGRFSSRRPLASKVLDQHVAAGLVHSCQGLRACIATVPTLVAVVRRSCSYSLACVKEGVFRLFPKRIISIPSSASSSLAEQVDFAHPASTVFSPLFSPRLKRSLDILV